MIVFLTYMAIYTIAMLWYVPKWFFDRGGDHFIKFILLIVGGGFGAIAVALIFIRSS